MRTISCLTPLIIKVATTLLAIGYLAGMLVASGCSSRQYDPGYWHENFVSIMQLNVGKKHDSGRGGWTDPNDLIGSATLSNGNLAYKYRYQGTCTYTFEVDPKTNTIVAARWEGEAKHCIIIP